MRSCGRCVGRCRRPSSSRYRLGQQQVDGGDGMNRVQAFLSGVWGFVVGDDWRTALGVVLALGLTALVAETSVAAWWTLPLAVLVLLGLSLKREAKGATRSDWASRHRSRRQLLISNRFT